MNFINHRIKFYFNVIIYSTLTLVIFSCTNEVKINSSPKVTKVYQITESDPGLKIKNVIIPNDKSKPLMITFSLKADGKTPISISKDQLSIHISNNPNPYLFVSDALFHKSEEEIITVSAGKSKEITVSALQNKFEDKKKWSDLKKGDYNLKVYINSGKELEFDYQWLGQTYSDEYRLSIK